MRKALAREGRAPPPKATPELVVVSEVLTTSTLRVELLQTTSGGARIVVHVSEPAARDAIIAAIRGIAEQPNEPRANGDAPEKSRSVLSAPEDPLTGPDRGS